jgi:hypothetical protein
MRTRNRTVTTTCPAGHYESPDIYNPLTSRPSLDTGPQTESTTIESMIDELSGMKKYGSVTHDKTVLRYFPVDLTYDYWYLDTPLPNPLGGNPRPCYRHKWTGAGMWRMYLGSSPGNTWGNPTIAVPSTYDWSTFSYNAVKNMRPNLNKSGLLLLNFMSELREGARRKADRTRARNEKAQRESAKQSKFSEESQKRHQRNIAQTRLKGRTFGAAVSGAIRAASKFNLFWQFAVQPTINDVRDILDKIKNLEKEIQKLIRESNKIQTRHYTCPIPDRITLPADIVRANVAFSSDQPGWGMREETRWIQSPRYTAVMRFNYDSSALQGLLGALRSRLNAFGVDALLSSVWEAVPFSFVVDWFINVGDIIESLEGHLNQPLPIVILDFSHSVKYSYSTRLIHNQGQLGTTHTRMSGILLMERSVTRYIRRAEAPCLWAKLEFRLPSLNQVLLGGSLFGSRQGTKPWK